MGIGDRWQGRPNLVDSRTSQEDDKEIQHLIRALQSLLEGQSAIDELVACGARAVPALRDFLLSGRVTSVPQPRMWAVEALAGLQAREVLIEYLQAPNRGHDPQLAFAEDAVRNTAARRLGAWRDRQTFEILLELCHGRNLPGVVESLAGFESVEAIPSLDRALEDDLCRPAAEEGLRRLGSGARRALELSALTPLPAAGEETPSSLCRRRSVLGLLAEMGVDEGSWPELRPILGERDPELLVRGAQLAATAGGSEDRSTAARRLVSVLPLVPWYRMNDAEEALVRLKPESIPPVEEERNRRSAKPPAARAADEILRFLLRVELKIRT